MSKPRLCDRAWSSPKFSVYKPTPKYAPNGHGWAVVFPGGGLITYATHDEAVHEAHRLAEVRAKRNSNNVPVSHSARWSSMYEPEYSAAETPPIATVQALMQAAWS